MRELVAMAAAIAELQRRVAGMMVHGTVAQVDISKHRVRIRIGGTDAKPVLSPWVSYAQIAGALKVHTPPSVGQQFTLLNPTGDPRQAVALPLTWSDQNASPSTNASENVLTFGNVRVTIKADQIEAKIGNALLDMKGDKITLGIGDAKLVITSGKIVTIKTTAIGLDGEDEALPPKIVTLGGPAKQAFAKV